MFCRDKIFVINERVPTIEDDRSIKTKTSDEKIIFAPDKNLGRWVMQQTGREMVLWDGACMVHEIFSRDKIMKLKLRHPEALVIAHPECETPVLELASFIGSTTALLNFTKKSQAREFIVATETGIIHQMSLASPDKVFIPAPPDNSCACNDCPHMKLNTLEKLYSCLKHEKPEINIPEQIRSKAENSIRRMLKISAELGL
jgi:quinolinate synthase